MLDADATRDSRIQERLSDIERALDALGYAAAADPATRTVLMAPKADSAPDPKALWRLITAAPVASFTDDELLEDRFLLTALERVFAE